MKTMRENLPLKDIYPDKKLTNHKARKTVLKKLKSSGIPKCEIKKTSLAKAPSKTTVIPVITSIVLSMFNITDDVTNA